MFRPSLLVVLFGACGTNASGTDAAGSTTIEVEVVYEDGVTPAPNVPVVFGDASGAVIVTSATDASGTVTIDKMPSVAMVTAMAMNGSGAVLETIMGIEPGDVLELYVPGGPPGPTSMPLTMLAGTFPANPPGGTDTWTFDAICSSTSGAATTFSVAIETRCQSSDATLDVIAIASHGTTPVAYSTQTVQVTGGTTTVTFPDGWRTDLTLFQQAFANAPTGVMTSRAIFSLQVAGDSWFPYSDPLAATSAGATIMQSYMYPASFVHGGAYGYEAHFTATAPDAVSQWQQFTETLPANDAENAEAILLPEVTTTGVSGTTSVRPMAMWSAAGPMQAATVGSATLAWGAGNWRLVFPPMTVSPVQVPELPDSLAAFRPPTDGSVTATPYVSFQADSYDVDYRAGAVPKTYTWTLTDNPD